MYPVVCLNHLPLFPSSLACYFLSIPSLCLSSRSSPTFYYFHLPVLVLSHLSGMSYDCPFPVLLVSLFLYTHDAYKVTSHDKRSQSNNPFSSYISTGVLPSSCVKYFHHNRTFYSNGGNKSSVCFFVLKERV